jgi:myo-inositol-1(or 4)-monophosphatase
MFLKTKELEKICNRVKDLALAVGDFIRQEATQFSSGKIETKGVHNYVTYVDKGAEEKLTKGLSLIIPGTGFITEEETTKRITREYTWVIDPLDGTTNFIHGLPPYSISIGLMKENKIILGLVLEVVTGECFYAWESGPALLNGDEIAVSKTSSVKDALIATGFPYTDFERFGPFMDSLMYFMRNTHGVRRLGSAAIDLAYLGCGRLDAFWEYSLNPWDVAAGAFIIEQAGGRVADFSGGSNYLFGKEIVAANALIFDEFLNIVGQYMNRE